MKVWLENIIICMIVLILIVLIIIGAVFSAKNITEKQDRICKRIADNSGLEFLEATKGDCGWGVVCNFQCRLLNLKGEIIVKNYP